jgi:surface protein
MEPFGNELDLKKDIIPKNKKSMCPSNKEWFAIISVILINIILGIILFISLSTSSKKEINNHKNEIICIYNVNNIYNEIPILGNEYQNEGQTIINIYINDSKIKYCKKYKFSKEGIYKIRYTLNEKVYLDNIFKNIESLLSLEMYSTTNDKIISIKSAFEGCLNLENVTIYGFNTEEIKSTSKLFYNSSISNLNISNFKTNNIEDMSYMFSKTNLNYLNLSDFNTNNVINMSNMFNICHLTSLNLSNFNTSKVNDMSSMFKSCSTLIELNLNNFDTKEVINMSNIFGFCSSMANISLNNFNTEKVIDMSYMFQNCNRIRFIFF